MRMRQATGRPRFGWLAARGGLPWRPVGRTSADRGEPLTRRILDSAHEAFISIDTRGRVTAWNAEAERTFGWSRAEALGESMAEMIVPPQHREAHRRGIAHFLATGEGPALGARIELTALRRDGSEFPIEMTIAAIGPGSSASFHAFLHDISERKRADQYREAQLALTRVLAEALPLEQAWVRLLEALATSMGWGYGGVWKVDDDGGVLRCQESWHAPTLHAPAFTALSRTLSFAPGVGLPGRVWQSGRAASIEDVVQDANFPRTQVACEEGLHGALCLPIRIGGAIWGVIEFFSCEPKAADEPLLEMLTTVGDQIGQFIVRKSAEQQLAHRAVHDSLTGLPNRTLFLDRFGQALKRLARRPGAVAVLFLDLDGFKLINDSRGHGAGDEVLRQVGRRLTRLLRPSDTVARFGGDEFTILCPDLAEPAEAESLAERIAQGLSEPFTIDDEDVLLSASIGIALTSTRNAGASVETVLGEADTAMYHAKKTRRSSYVVFDHEMGVQGAERVAIETGLREAIGRDELRTFYQPQISLSDARIVGVEALVRWEHPERGLLAPGAFIDIAEESGLMVSLGAWVLREACEQAGQWQREHRALRAMTMSVNLSARQLVQPDLPRIVTAELSHADLAPQSLCLEITESAMMAEPEAAIRALTELKQLGVGLAIDDFGAGFSSFSQLRTLPPVDIIKIDRSFVAGLASDHKNAAIVRSIVDLANGLGLKTIAEGVESQEQIESLRSRKCDMAQGFFFARPRPAPEIKRLLVDERHGCCEPSAVICP